jgi:hypothetical protein
VWAVWARQEQRAAAEERAALYLGFCSPPLPLAPLLKISYRPNRPNWAVKNDRKRG